METDMHRVIRTQELSDDHCQYFIYQVGGICWSSLSFIDYILTNIDTARIKGSPFRKCAAS